MEIKDVNEDEQECPECLVIVPKEELDMFGGLCEECSGAFDMLDTQD